MWDEDTIDVIVEQLAEMTLYFSPNFQAESMTL